MWSTMKLGNPIVLSGDGQTIDRTTIAQAIELAKEKAATAALEGVCRQVGHALTEPGSDVISVDEIGELVCARCGKRFPYKVVDRYA